MQMYYLMKLNILNNKFSWFKYPSLIKLCKWLQSIMNLLNIYCCIYVLVYGTFVVSSVLGINPFQFHLEDSIQDIPRNLDEHYVYIRGKHFLKNDSGKHEGSNGIRRPFTEIKETKESSNSPSWFPQCVDHFHSNGESIPRHGINSTCPESKRWNQRYWINPKHYQPGGPIFFMFGGEGSAEGYVDGGKWLEFAQHFGALVACLEHRFYGQSFPTLDSSFESMSLLTSQQALADAVAFIQWLKCRYNNSNLLNTKVVTFGGSYPGNLAAWMRQKYPEIVNVAVASSAPVEARLEYPEFLRTVSEVIYQMDKTCFWKIYKAFQCMRNLVSGSQCNKTEMWSRYSSPHELLDGLHQCQPFNFSVDMERQKFFHNLGARWGSNFPGHKSASKCITLGLQNNFDVIVDYGNFLVQTGQATATCESEGNVPDSNRVVPSDEEDEVVEFVKSSQGRDGKSWTWQTCHEFGYFQVADPDIQLFSDEWDSLIDIQRCQTIFPDANFTRESIESRIKLTNAYYKGKHYDGSCTIFINGQWDPWHSLGFNQSNETIPNNTVISIPQAEHCEDMKNDPNSSIYMQQAQQRIHEQIKKYLSDPNC